MHNNGTQGIQKQKKRLSKQNNNHNQIKSQQKIRLIFFFFKNDVLTEARATRCKKTLIPPISATASLILRRSRNETPPDHPHMHTYTHTKKKKTQREMEDFFKKKDIVDTKKKGIPKRKKRKTEKDDKYTNRATA